MITWDEAVSVYVPLLEEALAEDCEGRPDDIHASWLLIREAGDAHFGQYAEPDAPVPDGHPLTDPHTADHLEHWLEQYASGNAERVRIRRLLRVLLTEHPTLVAEGRSWPELLMLAERNYPEAG